MIRPAFTLPHAAGACPIHLGRGALAHLPALLGAHLPGRRAVVIADARVAAHVPVPLEAPCLTFPPGEASKTRDAWADLTDRLLAMGLGRDGAVVALGGGVTGDLAGFVAATYLRGIPVVQVPTSLLAMVDAAIGGKTGVDVPAGKNLVGAFHPPAFVLIDPAVLASLPPREFRGGLAEVVKHALVADPDHFAWLEANPASLMAAEPATVDHLVDASVGIKVAVVAADERETGRRAILNAGHTVAHALEHATGYALHHGEAVAIGLVVETRLGEHLGHTAAGTSTRVAALLSALELPTALPAGLAADALLDAMRHDKKNRGGSLHVSLPRGIGEAPAPWTTAVTPAQVRAAL